jgi:predicted nucleotidyltransferase
MAKRVDSKARILRVFFDFPHRVFQLRELSRETGVSLPSVRNHVLAQEAEGVLQKRDNGVYSGFRLGEGEKARVYKRNDILARLHESGIVGEIERKFRPNCVVLYGSAAEGRDDERGDVDLFVQADGGTLDLGAYEKSLGRKLSLLFEPKMGSLSQELVNSLANGVTLSGFLKVRP